MKRVLFTIFAVMFVLVLTRGNIWAQATAQISGTVKDQSGAVLPGVDVTATQIETGVMRTAVTNETGSYVLANLPIGPYRLEAALPGFRTFVQTGIVLQVNGSPVINPALEVGQVTEQVEVQANASLVETRSAGVGQVIENARILELPLNGRAVVELVALAGAATPAPTLDGNNGRDPFAKGNVSVAGGMHTGLVHTLDGAYHNNPYTNGYMPLPFPDALQEFKVETGATGAQTGMKSSGSVSLVTKSGTNELHGDAFEFVRNGMFNARNAFASRRDSIKRNQFGGTAGGAIAKNRLFFFGGYQGTTIRQDPSDIIAFVPTPAILAGDFTAFASPACNAGRQITLRAPFVNNRVDPALFARPAVRLAAKLPGTPDPCGRLVYTAPGLEDGHQGIGRIDYQKSANNSIFGRYLIESVNRPAPYDLGQNVLNSEETGNKGLAQAFTIGDTYLFGANVVNALRLTANRHYGAKNNGDFSAAGVGAASLGIKSYEPVPGRPNYSITGALNTVTNGLAPDGSNSTGATKSAIFSISDDLSLLHGNHQLALGAQYSYWQVDSYSSAGTGPNFTFNGQTTGLGMSDFFLGLASTFSQGTFSEQQKRGKYFGLYGADTWKLTQKLTLSYGLRWEPYFPVINKDGSAVNFSEDRLRQGIRTQRFTTAPPGVFFNGDPGFPGLAGQYKKWANFSPRLGFAWDVNGDGRTSVRASAGTFYDFPATLFYAGLTTGGAFSPQVQRTNVSFEDPWAGYPGGEPFPRPTGPNISPNTPWPIYNHIMNLDYDTPNVQVYQWNLSIQRQIGTDWLVSASYLGSHTIDLWSLQQTNPSLFLGLGPCTLNGVSYATCSTTANRDERRRLRVSYPTPGVGNLYGNVARIDSGGTASYSGMLLSVQRQAARGITVSGNYTWSHCISEPWDQNINSGLSGTGWQDMNDRQRERGNCVETGTDRRHIFNLSGAAETPRFSNQTLRIIGSGWRLSPIFRVLSGSFMSVTTNQDRALSGTVNQRVNQIVGNPYGDKTPKNYLNPAAFALPDMGSLGNVGRGSIKGPGTWQFDAALSRTFTVHEAQKMEFRAEAFNITNSLRLNSPTTNLNSNIFGQITSAQDPRILQFALKYIF